jgi:hypothetical protein
VAPQLITVAGFTTIRAECHLAQVLERATQNSRSAAFSWGCFMVRE